jgi:ribosomal protein S11
MNNVLILHIKIFRNNFFLIISNMSGKILFTNNSGISGFKNMNKKDMESLAIILLNGLKFILKLEEKKKIFLKLEGQKKNLLREVYKQLLNLLKKFNHKILGVIFVNKVSFNGCRKKKIK